jgi:hypothetical protein
MTLATDTTFNGLAVCAKCGWPMAGPYEEQRHKTACPYVTLGTSASALAERVDELPSTKFGYGNGQLTFELDKDLHVRLQCNKDGTFKLDDLWLLDNLTADEAADLVRAIAAWRRGCKNTRRR